MLEKLVQAMAVPDIRKRVQYVLGIFAIYVLALHVPAAGVDHGAVAARLKGVLGMVDVFSGGALRNFSVIAMGIMPYINASIVMQLLTVAIPQLQALSKEGETGRRQISKYTRYASVGLSVVQAVGMYNVFSRPMGSVPPAIQPGFLAMLTTVITLTAGTMFLLWLGEQITEKGIGNGVSLIIFVGIVVKLPEQIFLTASLVKTDPSLIWGALFILVLFLASVISIIYMTQATRRIPVRHVKRIIGTGNQRQMTQESSSYLPLKVNTAGVIPIIFATSILLFPATFATYFPPTTTFGVFLKRMTDWMNPGSSIWASLVAAALVLFFTYFYTALTYDTADIADNLKKYGSFIPGIKPGRPTAEYLDRVLTRITFAGALFLAVIFLIQYWAPAISNIRSVSMVGGTSLLIVVGVALETMQAIEAQMAMRNYEGFVKSPTSAARKTDGGGSRAALGGAR